MFQHITELGLSGWFLFPTAFLLLAIAVLDRPDLPEFGRGVLAAVSVRLGFMFMSIALPGLFTQIGDRYGVELSKVPAIGDSLRDLQAAQAVGCETHLVRTGKCAGLTDAQIADIVRHVPGTVVHADLATAAEFIVQRERHERAIARGTVEVPDSNPGALGA